MATAATHHADILDIYWSEIKDNEPLSRQEEAALFQRVRAGDQEALNRLARANLRFVVSVAREYCMSDGPVLMDLIAEGNMGLLRAIERFDETRGFKFITYAVWWIRQAILKALPTYGRSMRLPMSHINDLHYVEREAEALSQKLGRQPTLDEIEAKVDMNRDRLSNALAASQQDLSLDAPLFDGEATSLLGSFPAAEEVKEGIDPEALAAKLQESLRALDEREARIVEAYFGLNGVQARTLEEIGRELGVTRERVRQLRNRAMHKMRALFEDVMVEVSAN